MERREKNLFYVGNYQLERSGCLNIMYGKCHVIVFTIWNNYAS